MFPVCIKQYIGRVLRHTTQLDLRCFAPVMAPTKPAQADENAVQSAITSLKCAMNMLDNASQLLAGDTDDPDEDLAAAFAAIDGVVHRLMAGRGGAGVQSR